MHWSILQRETHLFESIYLSFHIKESQSDYFSQGNLLLEEQSCLLGPTQWWIGFILFTTLTWKARPSTDEKKDNCLSRTLQKCTVMADSVADLSSSLQMWGLQVPFALSLQELLNTPKCDVKRHTLLTSGLFHCSDLHQHFRLSSSGSSVQITCSAHFTSQIAQRLHI